MALIEKIAAAMGQVITWDGDPASHTLTKQELADLAQAALTAIMDAGDGVQEVDREAAQGILYCAEQNSFTADGQFKLDMELVSQAFARHRTLAAAAERARIVAWLRGQPKLRRVAQDMMRQNAPADLADAIERGEV